MSRAKPYSRDGAKGSAPRDMDSQWTHDMYDTTRTTLSDRLRSTSTGSGPRRSNDSSSGGPARAGAGSGSLLDRLSGGKGKELLPPAASSSKLFGFDDKPARELLPEKAARSTRSSRPRGVASAGQRNLVANSLGNALASNRTQVVRPIEIGRSGSASASGSASPAPAGFSIMGAAGVTVKVEYLAKGTTAEDVKSAFAPTPILAARLTSTARDRTATVEVDVSDRDAARDLISRFNGVVADGETLKVTIVQTERGSNGRGAGGGGSKRELVGGSKPGSALGARIAPGGASSRKMYSDSVLRSEPRASTITVDSRGPSLAARLGRR